MGLRRKSRELALQTLYQSELTQTAVLENFQLVADNFQADKKARPYAEQLLKGVQAYQADLDALIIECASNWRIERMSIIDRNILRITLFEARYQDDVPFSVAMNEAIEIARRFSTDESTSFINGILDAAQNKSKAS